MIDGNDVFADVDWRVLPFCFIGFLMFLVEVLEKGGGEFLGRERESMIGVA